MNRTICQIVTLALLALFLGAQVHFLADVDPENGGGHPCPICSLLTFAILLALPALCSLSATGRAELASSAARATEAVFRFISSRAPPLAA